MAVELLRRAGVETSMTSVIGQLEIDSFRHVVIKASIVAEDVDCDVELILPSGGRLGTENP